MVDGRRLDKNREPHYIFLQDNKEVEVGENKKSDKRDYLWLILFFFDGLQE